MAEPRANELEAALDRRVDPVAEAATYQRLLLDVLGDRDPATAQGETPDRLEALLKEAGTNLRTKPAPGEWSAFEVFAHIYDAEIVYSGRYRWILAHDEPPLIGYDQDLWVDRLHHDDEDPREMLVLFRTLRRSNLELWSRTPERDRARVGIHSERGPESFGLSFRLIAGHDLLHIGQMRRTLTQVSR
jgi:DinB family protein